MTPAQPANGRRWPLQSASSIALHLVYPQIAGSGSFVVGALTPSGRCSIEWTVGGLPTARRGRKPGGQWGWFYYDHEDWYWGHGRSEVDTTEKRINIYRNGRVTVTFEWESERFRLLRTDFPQRTLTGAQELMPAGWTIAQQ